MLSIGKLGQGQADYYLRAVGQGIEDYYTGAGEARGRWLGGAAAELEVAGGVDADGLRAALTGNHPRAGGGLAGPSRGAIRVPGFDLTFSAPKSVSVLFGLGDAEVSRQVCEAHEAAVDAALGYMERQAAVARRGRGGSESVLGNGFLAAAFRHRTSRAGDPQLHTHVLVANMTRGRDGRWTALDARRLYANAKTGGYLYQAQLRAELVRRLGVEWTPVRRGQAEVAGVPSPVLRAFSRRRAELEAQMAERGEGGARAAQVAALDTRQAKDYQVRPDTLRDGWRQRSRQLGFAAERLHELVGRDEPRRLEESSVQDVEERLGGPGGLTERRSSFARRDVVQAWCEQLAQGADVAVVEQLVDRLLGGERVVPLACDVRGLTHSDVIRRADGRVVAATAEERRYSTPELLARERAVIDRVVSGRASDVGVADPTAVADAIERRPELTAEQREMIKRLTGDGDAVGVVVGKAGAGKTFALDAAREAWQHSGHEVLGAAVARRAAHELHAGAGIQSTSVAALLQDLRSAPAPLLHRSSVLVVDEAGMLGTRQLAELLDRAAAAEAKVVLVGDDRQLPEIDAGGLFRALLLRTDPIRLHDNRRQQHAWEREALDLLREGRAGAAIERYVEHGRVVVEDRATDARGHLVEDWWSSAQTSEDAIMLALRRADVEDLNARARDLMATSGGLGEEQLTIGGRPFARGDQVVCLRNATRLGVQNGTRGVVTTVDPESRALELRTPDGRDLSLPAGYLDGQTRRGGPTLDYGYALTGHKAQGMTSERTYVLGGSELFREWGYVAMSRGRLENRFYVVAPAARERDEIAPSDPERSPTSSLTRALSQSRAQTAASDAALASSLASTPTAELVRQRDELSSDERATANLARQLHAVRAQRERAQRILDQHRTTPTPEREPRSSREQDVRGAAIAAQAADRVRSLADREDALHAQLERADATTHAPSDQARLPLVENELNSRRARTVRALDIEPAGYLVAELGPVPDHLADRKVWQRAARRVVTYREDFDVRDPHRALGSEPRELRQRDAWRIARRDLDEAHAQLHKQPVHREYSLELER